MVEGHAPAAPRRVVVKAAERAAPALERGTLFLPCAGGAEALLAEECQRVLGGRCPVEAGRGGVYVEGDIEAAMALNLQSRLAQRVLWQLIDGPYANEQDLYALARRVRWADWITPKQTLRVDASAWRSPLKSINFAALRIKDAVCDVMREASGERPSVDTRHPDLSLVLHLGPDHASLSVDLSGEALFKRGWRDAQGQKGEAPLKETLAAAMLAAAGWRGRPEDGGLLDPCCGAGTIAIEAAQIACGLAPGLARRFAFEKLLPFRPHLGAWAAMRQRAQQAVHAPAVPIWAGDVSFRMTDFATRNAERAGVRHAIEFKTADVLQRPAPGERGLIVMNPPYGERIAPKGQGQAQGPGPGQRGAGGEKFEGATDAADFYARLAAHWKKSFAGWTAHVLTPEAKLPALMRLKESRRVPMWNGAIECRLFRFDIVSGSNR
ncbi:THUMP domain-containing class I SAM-dependent RNA methyltransferase [Ideonella sp. YS5]|uniref:THUMP domain-containing class I SAM-dependent RNA methyltransferase n=1 Tax=Ideonella sp. YS5 TaxID=3453714 RepID=UPI003EEADE4E